MTYYVLLVALWVSLDGDFSEQYLWAMDTGLTLEECEKLKTEATPYILMMDGELSCEVDNYAE